MLKTLTRYALVLLWAIPGLVCGQSLSGLTLINAHTEQDIGPLAHADTLNTALLGNQLNVRAEADSATQSVRFELNGQVFRTESVAPFTLAGDQDGDFFSWSPSPGLYQLTVIPFSQSGAGGTAGQPISIEFWVADDEGPLTPPTDTGTGIATVSGERKQWHRVTIDFDGPTYQETATTPNPFLDFRLEVTFTQGNQTIKVPGFFAADGQAGETSADSGNVWRVHFAPPTTGAWQYTASFRFGKSVAINDNVNAGLAIASIDGQSGQINIAPNDKSGRDFRARGRLQYVGEHYLQFAGDQSFFVKGGSDAPENLLAYEDFDNTPNHGDRLKSWAPHADDWNSGDPSWQNGKGTEIIGAINYLAGKGLNAFSFLTLNINGDDKNVFPYVSEQDFKHFDCSKLDQWEILFSHADRLGMYLHFKTQETENDQLLDGGDLGPLRKLYYRELIARYAHHLALNWNLGEENTQTTAQRKDMASYFADHDPYHNHIVLHTYPNQQDQIYPALLGTQSKLTGASIQKQWNQVHNSTLKWLNRSAQSGVKWVVANDEQGGANTGVPHDGYTGTPSLDGIRKQTLWGNLMAGGAGVEYYFGYNLPHSDLTCQDFRSRDTSWDYVSHAIGFFSGLPLTKMNPSDDLASNGWCLADVGRTYLVYLKDGNTSNLNISIDGQYQVQWFDPRNGGDLQEGTVAQISGAGQHALGAAPSTPNQDWAVLITRIETGDNVYPVAHIATDNTTGVTPLQVKFDASGSSDSDGQITRYDWNFGDGTTGEGAQVTHYFEVSGSYEVTLTVYDNNGGFARTTQTIVAQTSVGCGQATDYASKDFEFANTRFYIDNFTGMPLLAITPDENTGLPVSATAYTVFDGEACSYDVTIHGVGEFDGQASFALTVNSQPVGAYTLPLSEEEWEIGPTYNKTFTQISLKPGDTLKVTGTTASADGQEWSRARWLKLGLAPAACDEANVFTEQDGYLLIEAEKASELGEGWQITNSFAQPALGEGHLEYTGPNSYGAVVPNTIFEYKIKINTPGTYQFKWRSRNGAGALKFDEENDSWLQIEASEFYGTKGEETHQFGDDFIKVWIQNREAWSWNCFGEHHGVNGMNVYAKYNNPGTYTIKIAGRSHGHPIDRIALFLPDKGSIAMDDATLPSPVGCNSGSEVNIWASETEYAATLLTRPIKIDGVTDEDWEYVEEATGRYESGGQDMPNDTDLAFSYRLGYDAEYAYLHMVVNDDVKLPLPKGENNREAFDNVEVYFNPDNQHNGLGAYGVDDIQIRMNYGVHDHSVSGKGEWNNGQGLKGLEYVFEDTKSGYVFEAKIPWESLLPTGMQVTPNILMGFEIQVNDRDNAGQLDNSLSWANDTRNNIAASDTRKFGLIRFKEEEFRFKDKSNWKVIYVDSESTPGGRDQAIDDDINTFWHTEWKDNQPELPHEIIIDFNDTLAVDQVHYLHRQDQWGPNGAIGEYEIYLSYDTTDWGMPVVKGAIPWPDDLATNYKMPHTIQLPEVTEGRFIRLVALTEAQNRPEVPFTAIAELDIVTGRTEIPLGLKQGQQSDIKLYPNPTGGNDIVVRTVLNTGKVVLTDTQGKVVFERNLNQGSTTLPTSKLASGLYMVRILSKGQTSVHKIMVAQ